MSIEDNPFLQPENYHEGYQKNIDKLKNNSESVELEKLCYLVFTTEDGRKLMETLVDRYMLPSFVHPNSPNIRDAAVYFEGFKQAFRMMRDAIKSHEQRILAENTKQ